MISKPIKAGCISEGTSRLVVHALRDDGSAACSSYLYVRPTGSNAKDIQPALRCKAKACQKLFAHADTAASDAGEGK